jgi:omega-amidase
MKVALAQTDIFWEDKTKNKESSLKLIVKAAEADVDFIIFPEMSFTGFSMNVDCISEEINSKSETVEWFKKQAITHNINIGFGYVEKSASDKKGKNNYCVISSTGNILNLYSKLHPFSYGLESQYYIGGNDMSLFKLKDFIVSTFICYDLRFPEIFQIASKNAGLITVAASWPKVRIEHWITLLKARAIENQCYVAGVNRVGVGDNIEYNGNSLLIDPLGNVLLHGTDKEELLIHDISIDEVTRVRENFKVKNDRREDLYCSLYKNIIL